VSCIKIRDTYFFAWMPGMITDSQYYLLIFKNRNQ